MRPRDSLDWKSGCGGWIRTNDLRVMSPTSCHCSTPRRKDSAPVLRQRCGGGSVMDCGVAAADGDGLLAPGDGVGVGGAVKLGSLALTPPPAGGGGARGG